MRKLFSLLFASLLLCHFLFAQTPNGTLNFGSPTNGTVATTANTGFGGLRIGSGGGGFTLLNPGQSIGTDGELRGIAPTTGSVNSVGITSTEFGSASTAFTITFDIYFTGGASGNWYFFAGTGSGFDAPQSTAFSGTQVFTGLQFQFGSSDAITTNNRSASSWVMISGTPFSQNVAYYVQIVGNNSASATILYGGSYSVAPGKFDLWVNNQLVGDDLSKGQLASASNINAFRFYGEASTGNVAAIHLDNIRWYNTCELPVALPVSFSSIYTTKIGKNNLVTWSTASEEHNRGFDVQRSTDGVNYTSLGFVNSLSTTGNSSSTLNYSFTDFDPIGLKQYYRLKQTDFDGTSRYSGVVVVINAVPERLAVTSIYPNPASSFVHLSVASPSREAMQLIVTDANGRTVRSKYVNAEIGNNSFEVDATGLGAGVYYLSLKGPLTGWQSVGKFVKN